MTQNERIRKAARAYIEAGYAVAAVDLTLDEHGKKVPHFHGSWNDAITDLARVDEVFATSTGIAISTDASGIVVLDVDVSGGKDGWESLSEADVVLPDTTFRVSTWSDGEHLFFRQPLDPVGTGANLPVRDVDFRGVGGVVFAAPSVVLDSEGNEYGSYELTGDWLTVGELPVLPESYASMIRSRPNTKQYEDAVRVDPALLRDDQRERIEQYINSGLHAISEAGPGQRNEVLGKNVLNVVSRAQQLGLGYSEVRDRVLDAYERSGGQDEAQAENHVRSAWTKCAGQVRELPRTPIDDAADREYVKIMAKRLATARVTGDASRLLTESSFVDWSVDPPEPAYWIDGLIPQGEQVVLYGQPEAGKTFLALDWGLSVACSRTTFGRATTPGRVLYMSGEGNARITSRMHAWMSHHGVRPEQSQFLMTNHVPDLMSDQVIENLAREIARREIDLVIIDTLGRAMSIGGGDISSPPDTAQALKNMQAISAYRPSTTPIVIHHPIKSGGMAGAYNLLAGVDVALFAEVPEGSTEGTLVFKKRKDGVKGEVCTYQWKDSGRSAVLVPGSDSGYGQSPTTI